MSTRLKIMTIACVFGLLTACGGGGGGGGSTGSSGNAGAGSYASPPSQISTLPLVGQ